MAQMTRYSTLNKEGVDVTTVYTMTASTTPEYPAPPFLLGEEIIGTGGSTYVFVQASTSVSPNDFVVIDAGGYANSMTNTNIAAAGGNLIGVAPGATSGNGGTNASMLATTYFWAQTTGLSVPGNGVAAATTSNVQLYTTAVAGVVSSITGSSGLPLGGVVMVASATANPQTFQLTWPRMVAVVTTTVIGGFNP